MVHISNKIFQAMIEFIGQKLFDMLIDKLKFKKKKAKNMASGYIDGGYVTIYFKGKEVTIIIPDENLTEEECRKIAKKILLELYKLAEIELDMDDITIKKLGFASGICNYCLIKALTFKCHRCKGYYCADHRLPENHNCPVKEKTKFEIRKKEKHKDKKEQDKKSKEIIIEESHCG